MKKLSLIIGLSVLLVSCSKMFFVPTNGVKNTYMLRDKQMPDNNYYASEPIMRISRVEPAGDSVRLYTHILDTDNSFLSGAARGANRRLWCTLTVNGIQVSDYNVREVYEDANIPTVYALVLDHSGSMSGKVTSMQNAVRAFINKKKPQDAICIVKYDSRAGLEVPITTIASQLQTEFRSDGLGLYGGTTAILNGIMLGMETIKPSAYRRKVVISFTDGADNSSTVTKEYVTWYAQQNNINLCTIDFNNSPYNDFMPELANTTGGTYTYFNNTNDFNNVFDDVVNKMNHSYIVSYKTQTAGAQSVILKYCAEPTALEAHADFNTIRSNAQPVRDVPRPIVDQSAAQADKPIYTRPVSNYPTNYTGPLKGSSTPGTTPPRGGGSNGSNDIGGLKGSPDSNGGGERPGSSPANNGGNVAKPGGSTPTGGGVERPDSSPINNGSSTVKPGSSPVNGSTDRPDTSPANNGSPDRPASGNSNGIGVSKPAPSNNNNSGGNTKPNTSPANNGSPDRPASGNSNGIGVSKPAPSNGNNNSGNSKPGTSPANSGSADKPAPGNNNGIGFTKPAPSNNNNGSGNGSSTNKPETSPAGGSSTTKPSTTKPSTTTPSTPVKGSSTTPSTSKPATTTTPVKGNDTNNNNKGKLGQIRGPQ